MPPLPRLRVAALRDLADQLRYASREALLKDLVRIENLASMIDANGLYDEDWLVGEVTGYRPSSESPARIVGEAVMYDLSALVERLSSLAGLGEGDLTEPVASIEDLCRRWEISRKSVDRYRKRGLIARRIVDGDGRERLVFPVRLVSAFERGHEPMIRSAQRYSRIDPATHARVLHRARELRIGGNTLNEAALTISREIGRSHEAVRQILRKHDERHEPIFGERGPVSERERQIAFRAWLRGVDAGPIARRLRRSSPSIRRAINVERAERLASIRWMIAREGTERRTGGAPEILGGVHGERWTMPSAVTTIRGFLALASAQGAPVGAEERARAVARQHVLARARERVASIRPSAPSAGVIDEAETLLRWSQRLSASLVLSQMPTIVRTLEGRVARPLESVRAGLLRELLEVSIASAGDAVGHFDPATGGRLAARVGLAVDRAITPIVRAHAGELVPANGRALPRLAQDAEITDWQDILSRSLAWLELPARARARLGEIDGEASAFLRARFGLDQRPRTLDELVGDFGLTRITAPRFERGAIRQCLAAGVRVVA